MQDEEEEEPNEEEDLGHHSPSPNEILDKYDDVFEAASDCNSSSSEIGSVFERSIHKFRHKCSRIRRLSYVDRQAGIARCR